MKSLPLAAFLLTVALAAPVHAQVPPGYESSYAEIVTNAAREGALQIDTTTDEEEAGALLAGFHALYPMIRTEYRKWNSDHLYKDFVTGADGGSATADIIWSSAMDLQIKLVNDGYAQTYVSPEAPNMPQWAVWRYQAYGTTAEPVAIVYNKARLPAADVPRSHGDLTRLLTTRPDLFQGKVATYDPERSGAGFLFITQDAEVTPRTWDLVRAMGQVGAQLYTSSATMLDRVESGEQWLAYNILGSYADRRARQDPNLGVVLPTDYTILVSRIAFIPKAARHPNAAKLFLDYMLSRQGQSQLAAGSLNPIRADAATGSAPAIPTGARPVPHPIQVGPELLTYLDQAKRARFLKEWRQAMDGR